MPESWVNVDRLEMDAANIRAKMNRLGRDLDELEQNGIGVRIEVINLRREITGEECTHPEREDLPDWEAVEVLLGSFNPELFYEKCKSCGTVIEGDED